MTGPPSLTGSGSGGSFASDEDECKYLKGVRRLHWARIAVTTVVLILALIGVACEAHPLDYYHKTRKHDSVFLPLWPANLELRPSVAFIVCNTLIFVSAAIYLVVALLPSPRSRTTLLNHASLAVGFFGISASIIAIGMHLILTNPHEKNGAFCGETIHSWTCTWSHTAPLYDYNNRQASPANIEGIEAFGRLCAETKGSLGATSCLIVFELTFAILAALGWRLEQTMLRKRNAAAAAVTSAPASTAGSFASSQNSFGEKIHSVETGSARFEGV